MRHHIVLTVIVIRFVLDPDWLQSIVIEFVTVEKKTQFPTWKTTTNKKTKYKQIILFDSLTHELNWIEFWNAMESLRILFQWTVKIDLAETTTNHLIRNLIYWQLIFITDAEDRISWVWITVRLYSSRRLCRLSVRIWFVKI